MPFYEYECSSCKFYVEALQKISDTPLRECPSCHEQTLERLMSAPVFRLKGGGWYETDFKSDQEAKRNLAGREEPAETKAAEGKESKPEAKEPAKPAEAKVDEPPSRKRVVSKPVSKPAAKAPAKRAKSKPKAKAPAGKKKAARR